MAGRGGRSAKSVVDGAAASQSVQPTTPAWAESVAAPECRTTVPTRPASNAAIAEAAPLGPVIRPTMVASSTWSVSSGTVSCRDTATVPTPAISPAAWAMSVGAALSPRTPQRWSGSRCAGEHRGSGGTDLGIDLRPGALAGRIDEGDAVRIARGDVGDGSEGQLRHVGSSRSAVVLPAGC